MRWLYELFNVDQIRIIFVLMFSSLLAYLTPTKGFLIALVIMFEMCIRDSVWSFGRAASRARAVVLRVRIAVTIHRMRLRTTVPGSPSEAKSRLRRAWQRTNC